MLSVHIRPCTRTKLYLPKTPFVIRRQSSEICSQGNELVIDNTTPVEPVSEFRTVLPQVLASTVKNLLSLNLGMLTAFTAILVATLLKSDEGLKLSDEESSWFSSISLICEPAASVTFGVLFDKLGRKKNFLLVNIPYFTVWVMFYFSTSVTELYVARVIMGIGIGMEASILSYVGEISHPKWRGVLTSYSGIFIPLGSTGVFLLGTITDWRTIAAICAAVPVITMLLMTQIPESPVWLLSKGRLEEAERALCWLRGWVDPELIRTEYNELLQHNYKPQLDKGPPKKETHHPPDTVLSINTRKQSIDTIMHEVTPIRKIFRFLQLDELYRRQTLQPLLMIIIYLWFFHASGLTSTRPYMVTIFEEMDTPLNPNLFSAISSMIGFAGHVICMTIVEWMGKKMLATYSIGACAALNFALCATGFALGGSSTMPWLSATLYILLTFAWSCGVSAVPWMYISEVFPFKGRGVAGGVASAISFLFAFVVIKTYNNLYNWLTLPGVFGVYGIFSVIGCVYFYFCLPVTDGKSLEEIEEILENHFNSLRKRFLRSSK